MTVSINPLGVNQLDAAAPQLAGVLHACVLSGASVGFVLPFQPSEAQSFWTDHVFPSVRNKVSVLLVAQLDGQIVGTVTLGLATMPNQPHRADIGKLLVHPDHRRRGIARRLMQSVETEAQRRGRRLLVLDTRSKDPSQRLYESMGYQVAGEIPGYCLNPHDLSPEPTTYLFKPL